MNILIGVTGGIAAYKMCSVVNKLKLKHDVRVVMTENATKFVGPLTFEALTQNPVMTSMWVSNEKVNHIEVAQNWADIFVVAPATANTIAKLANGIADDLLSTMYLACDKPVIVAPAMNTNMLKHTATQINITRLMACGVMIISPIVKLLACGVEGAGALASTEKIVEIIEDVLK